MMIDGVVVKDLIVRRDYRGRLMEILRCDEEIFSRFGQVYMTTAKPGIVKGWHYHKKQTDNFALVKGKGRVGLYDNRQKSPTKRAFMEILLSEKKPKLIRIPPRIYHGFECLGKEEAIFINIPDKPYKIDSPDEIRIHPFNNDIPLKWKSKKGG